MFNNYQFLVLHSISFPGSIYTFITIVLPISLLNNVITRLSFSFHCLQIAVSSPRTFPDCNLHFTLVLQAPSSVRPFVHQACRYVCSNDSFLFATLVNSRRLPRYTHPPIFRRCLIYDFTLGIFTPAFPIGDLKSFISVPFSFIEKLLLRFSSDRDSQSSVLVSLESELLNPIHPISFHIPNSMLIS